MSQWQLKRLLAAGRIADGALEILQREELLEPLARARACESARPSQ